jgi:NodT family efflux transporter outer membrane factor (OMF) lipoprotein
MMSPMPISKSQPRAEAPDVICRMLKYRHSFMQAPRLLAGLLSVLLVACAPVGPEFVRPETTVAPQWMLASQNEFKTDPEELIEWWRVFDDLDLIELIELAHRNNNNLKIAGLRVLEARAALGIAVGNQYPQSQIAAGDATAIGASESNANTTAGDLNFTQYNLGVSASWEMDFWGKFRRGVESADATLLASIANFDDVFVLLTAQVAETYTVIRVTEEQLRIANENLALQQRSYDIVEVLYRNGASSELDALQALTLLLATKATIPSLDATLRQAENALGTLLGMPPGNISMLLSHSSAVPKVPQQLAVGVPANMLRQRPDVRRAEMQAMAQNALVGMAQAELYPSFSIRGSLGLAAAGGTNTTRTGNSGFGELFSADSLTYSIGPAFAWPFLNYGRIRNNIRVQDARLQQTLIAYRETVIQAAREVEDAMVGLIGAQQQGEILAATVIAARRATDISLLRYKEGFADYQRVLDAQQSLFTQQQRYATNQGNSVRALIALYRGLGGGWQTLAGQGYVDPETREIMENRINWGDLMEPGQAKPHRVEIEEKQESSL